MRLNFEIKVVVTFNQFETMKLICSLGRGRKIYSWPLTNNIYTHVYSILSRFYIQLVDDTFV